MIYQLAGMLSLPDLSQQGVPMDAAFPHLVAKQILLDNHGIIAHSPFRFSAFVSFYSHMYLAMYLISCKSLYSLIWLCKISVSVICLQRYKKSAITHHKSCRKIYIQNKAILPYTINFFYNCTNFSTFFGSLKNFMYFCQRLSQPKLSEARSSSFARLLLKGMQEWPMTMWTGRVKTIIDGILRPTMPFVGQAEGKRRLRTLSFCAV